jgi:hypothetical protein
MCCSHRMKGGSSIAKRFRHGRRKNSRTYLDERLDLAPFRQLLRTHTLRHLERVALNSSNDRMGIRALFRPLIKLLDDDHLVPGLPALKDDGNLSNRNQSISRGSWSSYDA